MGTLSRVVDRFVHEVGLPRTDSVRIARKLNEFAKSVDWMTPVEDDLDKLGRKRRRAPQKKAAAKKRAVAAKANGHPTARKTARGKKKAGPSRAQKA